MKPRDMMTTDFRNSANPKTRELSRGEYGFDRPSPYLWMWSRLLQSTISQAGTYLLTKKFHTHHCAIYKCEGGCFIEGHGDLVLNRSSCYWDHWPMNRDRDIHKLCSLITTIVLEWNPNDPIDSMLFSAAKVCGCDVGELKRAIENSDNGGPFSGNALHFFFNSSPFSNFKVDEDYERFCLINFNKMTHDEVEQLFADRKLGQKLLDKLIEKCKKINCYPICCTPRRNQNKLEFWINTGCRTQIDGWKTLNEIQSILDSDEDIKRL